MHSNMHINFKVFKILNFIVGILLPSCSNLIYAQRYTFAEIQGKYCETRVGGCCSGRDDECHTPILDHLCYCDDFCDDPIKEKNNDCCPDYGPHCKGISPPDPIRKNDSSVCYHEGQKYDLGSSRKENCNQCKCESLNPGDSYGTWMCESKPCMIDPLIMETVNQGRYGWKASNYSEFWGRDLADGLLYKLGTLEPENAVRNLKPVKYILHENIPNQFDARTQWPNFIEQISDQGWCGSDWAKTTAAITADRLAIMTKGLENRPLSAQHLLSCNREQEGCLGGHLDRTWNFMRVYGIVDEQCYPYRSGITQETGRCQLRLGASLEDCDSGNEISPGFKRTELYRTAPAYRISSKVEDIQHDLMTYGPVQAVMEVSADFFMYRSGVYRRPPLKFGSRMGHHSVRIVGWGEEWVDGEMLKYWTVANTWGRNWGENGIFKILRGENECEIETFVIASWPSPAKNNSARKKESRLLSRTKDRYYGNYGDFFNRV